jgi:hypothetical protein
MLVVWSGRKWHRDTMKQTAGAAVAAIALLA